MRVSGGVLIQYVDAKRAEHKAAYESSGAVCYGFGLMRVIFDEEPVTRILG
jgi:hypothetical protein